MHAKWHFLFIIDQGQLSYEVFEIIFCFLRNNISFCSLVKYIQNDQYEYQYQLMTLAKIICSKCGSYPAVRISRDQKGKKTVSFVHLSRYF